MTTKEKTWSQLEDEIAETFRKWRKDPPTITASIAKRSSTRRYQSREERSVTVAFRHWSGARSREIRLTMLREDRAIDNLAKIAQALEHLRMADSRKITDLVLGFYRQMYPEDRPASTPPPRTQAPPSGPYAVLHVADRAPLEVCEAAYRALARKAHPDTGGDTATMQRLNAAIEQIRKEHAK